MTTSRETVTCIYAPPGVFCADHPECKRYSGWREVRRRENAIDRIETAMRQVMAMYGGNLDHPALDHLGAAAESVRTFRPEPTATSTSGGEEQ